MTFEIGWSLAQAVSWIIQHKCGVELYADTETSIALLMNFEEDPRLPINVATESEKELLGALASGELTAAAIAVETGEHVDIGARDWLHLRISPSLDGDRVEGRSNGGAWGIVYRDIRFLPHELRAVWPPRQPGQWPRLRLVHDSAEVARVAASATRGEPLGLPSADATRHDTKRSSPTHQQIENAIKELWPDGAMPTRPGDRIKLITKHLAEMKQTVPSKSSFERFFRDNPSPSVK